MLGWYYRTIQNHSATGQSGGSQSAGSKVNFQRGGARAQSLNNIDERGKDAWYWKVLRLATHTARNTQIVDMIIIIIVYSHILLYRQVFSSHWNWNCATVQWLWHWLLTFSFDLYPWLGPDTAWAEGQAFVQRFHSEDHVARRFASLADKSVPNRIRA